MQKSVALVTARQNGTLHNDLLRRTCCNLFLTLPQCHTEFLSTWSCWLIPVSSLTLLSRSLWCQLRLQHQNNITLKSTFCVCIDPVGTKSETESLWPERGLSALEQVVKCTAGLSCQHETMEEESELESSLLSLSMTGTSTIQGFFLRCR